MMKGFADKGMTFALISGIVIFAVSTIVAAIFFGILESSAEATLQNWKLGGAIAGFAFSAILLTSITFQFYKQVTANDVNKYRDQVIELQSKLIRGAPCPDNYVVEVDERHKLVLSRPEAWLPKEGILYQYVEKKPGDAMPANFNVVYQNKNDLADMYKQLNLGPFNADKINSENLYEAIINASVVFTQAMFADYSKGNITKEFIFVDELKSMKVTHSYSGTIGTAKVNMCQCSVFTYVPRIKAMFQFTFTDNSEDYLKSSEVFNNVISSIRFLI
jgi:hypothetical protein